MQLSQTFSVKSRHTLPPPCWDCCLTLARAAMKETTYIFQYKVNNVFQNTKKSDSKMVFDSFNQISLFGPTLDTSLLDKFF